MESMRIYKRCLKGSTESLPTKLRKLSSKKSWNQKIKKEPNKVWGLRTYHLLWGSLLISEKTLLHVGSANVYRLLLFSLFKALFTFCSLPFLPAKVNHSDGFDFISAITTSVLMAPDPSLMSFKLMTLNVPISNHSQEPQPALALKKANNRPSLHPIMFGHIPRWSPSDHLTSLFFHLHTTLCFLTHSNSHCTFPSQTFPLGPREFSKTDKLSSMETLPLSGLKWNTVLTSRHHILCISLRKMDAHSFILHISQDPEIGSAFSCYFVTTSKR